MNPTDLQIFNQAVAAAQSGQTQAAYDTLTGLNQRYPHDANVLLWLAFTSSDWNVASAYIEKVALFEPHNPSLAGARAWLASQKPVAPPPAQPVAYPVFETAGAAVSSQPYNSYQTEHVVDAVPLPDTSQSSQAYSNSATSASYYDRSANYDNGVPTKPKLFWPKIIGAFVLVMVVVFFLATNLRSLSTAPSEIGGLQDNPPGVADLPAPANVKGLTATSALQDEVQSSLAKLKNPQLGAYLLSSGTPDNFLSTYGQQLKNKGWTLATNQTPKTNAHMQGYSKGGKIAVVLVEGPLTDDDLNRTSDEDKKILKSGSTMVILLEADGTN